jgi:uncharacterized protein YlxW (UPF0749 family)
MKGLISNLVRNILTYETSKRYQRRYRRHMISRASHMHLRREARTLAKLVAHLEKEIEDLHTKIKRAALLNGQYQDEIDRLEAALQGDGFVSAQTDSPEGASTDRT